VGAVIVVRVICLCGTETKWQRSEESGHFELYGTFIVGNESKKEERTTFSCVSVHVYNYVKYII
jgi:hypothetical protein